MHNQDILNEWSNDDVCHLARMSTGRDLLRGVYDTMSLVNMLGKMKGTGCR